MAEELLKCLNDRFWLGEEKGALRAPFDPEIGGLLKTASENFNFHNYFMARLAVERKIWGRDSVEAKIWKFMLNWFKQNPGEPQFIVQFNVGEFNSGGFSGGVRVDVEVFLRTISFFLQNLGAIVEGSIFNQIVDLPPAFWTNYNKDRKTQMSSPFLESEEDQEGRRLKQDLELLNLITEVEKDLEKKSEELKVQKELEQNLEKLQTVVLQAQKELELKERHLVLKAVKEAEKELEKQKPPRRSSRPVKRVREEIEDVEDVEKPGKRMRGKVVEVPEVVEDAKPVKGKGKVQNSVKKAIAKFIHEWFCNHGWTDYFIVDDIYKMFLEKEGAEAAKKHTFSSMFCSLFMDMGCTRALNCNQKALKMMYLFTEQGFHDIKASFAELEKNL